MKYPSKASDLVHLATQQTIIRVAAAQQARASAAEARLQSRRAIERSRKLLDKAPYPF